MLSLIYVSTLAPGFRAAELAALTERAAALNAPMA